MLLLFPEKLEKKKKKKNVITLQIKQILIFFSVSQLIKIFSIWHNVNFESVFTVINNTKMQRKQTKN